MSDLEFVLSLTPKQIFKFTEFNFKPDFMVGIITDVDGINYSLYIFNNVNKENFRMNYKWNNKWEEDYE